PRARVRARGRLRVTCLGGEQFHDGRTPFTAPECLTGAPSTRNCLRVRPVWTEPKPRGGHRTRYLFCDTRPNTCALCRRLWSTVAAPGGGGRVRFRQPSPRGVAGTVPLEQTPHPILRERAPAVGGKAW